MCDDVNKGKQTYFDWYILILITFVKKKKKKAETHEMFTWILFLATSFKTLMCGDGVENTDD